MCCLEDGQAKVAEFDVKLLVEENVLWLEVAVDQALLVEVAECLGHLEEYSPFCAVIFCLLLLILVLMWRQTQQIFDTSASAVLHLDVKDKDALLIIPQVLLIDVFKLCLLFG